MEWVRIVSKVQHKIVQNAVFVVLYARDACVQV